MLLLLFSHLVVSDCLWPYGLQHARLPCPSLSLGAFSNSFPLSCWCHPTLSSVVPFSSCLQSLPESGSFPLVSSSHQIAKVLEFQPQYISPSNEYSGLISSRIGWFDLLAVQGTLKSSPAPHFKSVSSVLSFLYGSTLKMHTLTFIHTFKNHGFDYMECYFISLPPPQPSYTPWKNHIPCPSHYSPLLCSINNFHLFTASFLAIYKFPLAPIFKNTEHKKQNLLLNTYLPLVTTLLLCFPSQLNLWKELASSQSSVLHL